MGFLESKHPAQNVAPAEQSFGGAAMPALKIARGPDEGDLVRIMQDALASGATSPQPLNIAPRVNGNVLTDILRQPLDASPDITPDAVARSGSGGMPRRSLIDTIGRISDVIAKVGGADPLYQSTLDANTARDRASITNDWENKFNTQKYEAGQDELQSNLTTQAGQMARGLGAVYQAGGAPAVQKAFPLIAAQLGIKPEQQALWQRALADDPEGTISALTAALKPANSGTDPKEITLYKLMHQEDPALAAAYLKRLSDPNAELTPYQQAQLDQRQSEQRWRQTNADRNFREGQYRFDHPQPKGGKGAGSGSTSMLSSVLGDLRTNYEALRKSGALVQQGGSAQANVRARARASVVGQLVEGALGTDAQTYRDNITNSRPAIIQAIVQATGMSAKQIDSNAELKLMLSQATDPTQSYESNMAALTRLERFVTANSGGGATPARPGARTPRPGTPPPRRPNSRGPRQVTATNW